MMLDLSEQNLAKWEYPPLRSNNYVWGSRVSRGLGFKSDVQMHRLANLSTGEEEFGFGLHALDR